MTALSPDRRLVSLSLKVVVRQASWILIFFFLFLCWVSLYIVKRKIIFVFDLEIYDNVRD